MKMDGNNFEVFDHLIEEFHFLFPDVRISQSEYLLSSKLSLNYCKHSKICSGNGFIDASTWRRKFCGSMRVY